VPEWIGRLSVTGVPILGSTLSFEVEGDRCEIIEAPPGLEIVHEARRATH
jgi:hypothetical protein